MAAEAREAIGPSADAYLQASTFLRLPRDAGGCVPAAALFRYCVARSAQIQLVRLGGRGWVDGARGWGWLPAGPPLLCLAWRAANATPAAAQCHTPLQSPRPLSESSGCS